MSHEELLEQARQHWCEATEDPGEVESRERGRDDARFADGEQWDPAIKEERFRTKRPALTFNRMEGFLHRVENELRQNRIEIKISPVDSGLDKDTAAVDQGLVRQIQYNSQATASTQAAFEEACRTGMGAFTLGARYVADNSFDQELFLRHIPDALNRCYFDPFAKEINRSDMRYAFEVDILSRAQFTAEFPNAKAASSDFWDSGIGQLGHDWVTLSGVRVANYWYTKTKRRKLLMLNTGDTIFEDEAKLLPGVTVQKDRMVVTKTVCCAKLNGVEVLEEYEWPGRRIPLFIVTGKERWVDGRRKRKSLIFNARDSQKLLNVYRSGEAEVIGLAPKTPFVAAEGQIEGYESLWQSANTTPYAVLPYKPQSIGGQLLPPPQRVVIEAPIQAFSLGSAQVIDEMKAAIGMYDASLGARSNETAGVAIRARQAEGETANYHFIDSLGQQMDACGQCIVEVKPFYYDTPRTVQILGEDEADRVVRVNEQYVDEKGVTRNYQISDTKYNVRTATGPSYTTKREEGFRTLTEFGRVWPQLFALAGDIIFQSSDFPGGDRVADRLKKALPPELADDDEKEQPMPPQVQAKLQALAQQNEQLTSALEQATSDINTRRLEIESRERIAALQVQARLIETQAKLGSSEAMEMLRQELSVINTRLASMAEPEPPPTEA